GSTFSTISTYLSRKASLHMQAQRISQFIFPLYIAFFVSGWINRYILRNMESVGDGLLLASTIFDAASLAVYLWFTIQINKCIQHLYTTPVTEHGIEAANDSNT